MNHDELWKRLEEHAMQIENSGEPSEPTVSYLSDAAAAIRELLVRLDNATRFNEALLAEKDRAWDNAEADLAEDYYRENR